MIDEILKENKTINLSKTMIVYLKELENYIPENLRTNFYNNLKTLKIANLQLENMIIKITKYF